MSQKHEELKKRAMDWLLANGYNDIEIEVKIPSSSGLNRKGKMPFREGMCCFIVDIVGRKDGKKIMVECGGSKPTKLDALLPRFDEIWLLPYGESTPIRWQEGTQTCQTCGHFI